MPSVSPEIEQGARQLAPSPHVLLKCASCSQREALRCFHFLFTMHVAFGPDNSHFNQDTYQAPTIWQAINLVYPDILTDKSIFPSIAGAAIFGGVRG